METKIRNCSRKTTVRRLVNFTVLAGMLVLLLIFDLPLASPAGPSLTVKTTKSTLKKLDDTTRIILYLHNAVPWGSGAGLREDIGNTITVTEIDVKATINGKPLFSLTAIPSANQQFSVLSPQTVTRTITSSSYGAGRWQPVVLPGETVGIWYIGWTVGCAEPTGTDLWAFTVHYSVLGSSTISTLTGSSTFTVANSFPDCVGGNVNDIGGNGGVNGAQVSLHDLTAGTTQQVLTAQDGSYFWGSSLLINGHSYQVEVTALPAPYTSATQSSGPTQPFTWTGSTVYVVFAAS